MEFENTPDVARGLTGQAKKIAALEAFKRYRVEVGRRLEHARATAGISQIDAARAMGYVAATQLCEYEQGNRLPGVEKIAQLVELYGTTADYILGFAPEPDRDPAAGVQRQLAAFITTRVHGLIQAMVASNIEAVRKMRPDVASALRLCSLVLETSAALDRMRELNPELDDDMKGLASVVRRMELAANSAKETTERLNHTHRATAHRAQSVAEDLLSGLGTEELGLTVTAHQ